MNVDLSKESAERIEHLIALGAYRTPQEVIEAGIQNLALSRPASCRRR
ncbi:hypothetical protein [Kolteria novifilia]